MGQFTKTEAVPRAPDDGTIPVPVFNAKRAGMFGAAAEETGRNTSIPFDRMDRDSAPLV